MSDKKITDRDYLFLTSMLRAREAHMVSADTLAQMLSSGSFSDAAHALSELGWTDMAAMDRNGVEQALNARRDELFAELERMAPQKELVELFRVRYDYHNAKTLIKGEGAGVECAYLLSGAGRVEREKLTEAFHEGEYRFLPPVLGKAMSEAKSILSRTDNPQLADFALDAACFEEMRAIAEKIGKPYITGYVQLLIDGANLRTAVRCERMGRDAEFVKSALLAGGTVSVSRILTAAASAEGVASAFAGSAYKDAAALAAECAKGGRLTAFELACDNAINRVLREAKRMSFGPEAVLGYIAAEENNITAVRMVLTGLLAGLPAEKLRERLRDTYA